MCRVIRQIKKDVPRTASTFSEPKFEEPIQNGQNPIYNILIAFAETDQQLGYTQGMNFMAAIIYVAVKDEVYAFTILQGLMQSK